MDPKTVVIRYVEAAREIRFQRGRGVTATMRT
jgi:hypothetical protein